MPQYLWLTLRDSDGFARRTAVRIRSSMHPASTAPLTVSLPECRIADTAQLTGARRSVTGTTGPRASYAPSASHVDSYLGDGELLRSCDDAWQRHERREPRVAKHGTVSAGWDATSATNSPSSWNVNFPRRHSHFSKPLSIGTSAATDRPAIFPTCT